MSTVPDDYPGSVTMPEPALVVTPPRRPGAATGAAVTLAVAGVLSVLFALASVVLWLGRDWARYPTVYVGPALQVMVGVSMVVAAVLLLVGRKGGVALGFATAGIGCWMGANAAIYTVVDVLTDDSWRLSLATVAYSGWLAVGGLSVAAALLMLRLPVFDSGQPQLHDQGPLGRA
ncbi:MAG: hypothetical protein ACRDT6_26380 [Micromonosporaceae bacterium]